MVADGGRLPDLSAQLRRLRRRRDRRPAGDHVAGPLSQRARRRRGVAEPVLSVGAGRRRLRRRRLPRRRPAAGHADDFDAMVAGAARRRDQGHRRHRAQPQLQPARLVRRGARRRPGRPHATATSSATAPARTAPSRPTTGSRCSAGRPGSACATASGIFTVRRGAARPQLAQRRGPGGLPHHAAVLGRPRRGRLPGRRGARAAQGPHRAVPPVGRDRGDEADPTARIRCGTATTCRRSTPSGARSSTSTTPRGIAVAEASVHPTRRARYAAAASLGQAFNFAMQDANFSAGGLPRR